MDANIDYILCNQCDEYATLFSARAIESLPDGYSGELCKKCNMWMCSVEHLESKSLHCETSQIKSAKG